MRRTVTECNEHTAPQCDALPSPFFLRERPPPTWRVLPETATPTPEQGTRTQGEEDGSLPRHSLAGTQAVTPGPDPPYPPHRLPNGNGNAGGRAGQGTLRRQCFALSDHGSSCDPPLLPPMLFSGGSTLRKGQVPGACCGPDCPPQNRACTRRTRKTAPVPGTTPPGRRLPASGRIPRTLCAAHRAGTAARGVHRPFLSCPA